MSLDIEGLDSLMKTIENAGKNIEKVQNKALNKGADIVLKEQQRTVNVDTGATQESLMKSGVRTEKGVKKIWVGDVKRKRGNIPYYLEYGPIGKKKRKFPFMRPALRNKKAEVLEAEKEVFREEIFKQ